MEYRIAVMNAPEVSNPRCNAEGEAGKGFDNAAGEVSKHRAVLARGPREGLIRAHAGDYIAFGLFVCCAACQRRAGAQLSQ